MNDHTFMAVLFKIGNPNQVIQITVWSHYEIQVALFFLVVPVDGVAVVVQFARRLADVRSGALDRLDVAGTDVFVHIGARPWTHRCGQSWQHINVLNTKIGLQLLLSSKQKTSSLQIIE